MSLMQVVGASFANLPFSQANSLLSQPSVPASQPAQPQSQPTVAQSADFSLHDTHNTRLDNEPSAVSEMQCRKPRAAAQECVEVNPGINKESSKVSLQVKHLNVLFQ